eukprot:6537-Eustigmatos_ZCMA.PRE.1
MANEAYGVRLRDSTMDEDVAQRESHISQLVVRDVPLVIAVFVAQHEQQVSCRDTARQVRP